MIQAAEGLVETRLIREPVRPSRLDIDMESIGRLADDIGANGLYQKPGVRGPFPDGTYEIVWGHRRLLAIRLLRWPEMPCMIYDQHFDPDVARIGENLVREELNPIEEAQECQRFIEKGLTPAVIGRLFRKSQPWVDGRLALLDHPEEIQVAVAAGELSLAVANILAQVDHASVRHDFVKDAIRSGCKSSTAEAWLYHYRANRDRIITNTVTVDEFIQQRESWKIIIPCQVCGLDCDYPDTASVRACKPCLMAVARLGEELRKELPAARS